MASWNTGGVVGPDRVRRYVSAVLQDIRTTGAVEPVLTDTAIQVWLYAGGTNAHGIAVRGDLDDERGLAAVAKQVQEWEVEELDRRGLRAVWPPCPLHPEHSLEADVVAARASWVCPDGDTAAGQIGRLGAQAGEPGAQPRTPMSPAPVPRQITHHR